MGSVQFNIDFGHFPDFPGLPAARMSLHYDMIDPSLAFSEAFVCDHITSRTIAVDQWRNQDGGTETGRYAVCNVGVRTPFGRARFTTFSEKGDGSGRFSGVRENGGRFPERLRPLKADLTPVEFFVDVPAYYEEVLEDGTSLVYEAEHGTFHSLTLPNGVTMSKVQLYGEFRIIREADTYTMNSLAGQTVEWAQSAVVNRARSARSLNQVNSMGMMDPRSLTQVKKGRLHQVWSRTDGLLDFEDIGSGYLISHYLPEDIDHFDAVTNRYILGSGAQAVKTWNIQTGPKIASHGVRGEDGRTYKTPEYLKFLLVTEASAGVTQSYKWLQFDEERLLFVKGTGETAQVILKTRKGFMDPVGGGAACDGRPGLVADFNPQGWGYSRTGQTMGVGGVPATRMTETIATYTGEHYGPNGLPVGTPCSSSKKIYNSTKDGNLLTYEEEGIADSDFRSVDYVYGTEGEAKGRIIQETHSDGMVITREYDGNGRLSAETSPWAGGGTQTIGYTYYNERFNDQRIRTRTVTITKDGTDTLLTSETYEIEETTTSRHTTVTRTGLGAEHPLVSEQKHCIDNGNPVAKGRVTWEKNETGIETWYTYTPVADSDPVQTTLTWADLWYKSTAETRVAGQVAPGKSSRQEIWYSRTDKPVLIRQYVHTGENFTLVDQEEREYDHKDRLIRTKSTLGTRTTEWSCRGPVTETDENLVMTQYEYNTAGRLSKKTRHATPHTCQIDGHPIPTISLPSTIGEYHYDGTGNILTDTTTRGTMIISGTKQYDRLGRPVKTTDPLGRETRYTYSADSLTETITHPIGYTLVSRRHTDGQIQEESGTGQQTKHYTYTLTALGLQTQTRLDTATGPLVRETTTNGLGNIVQEKHPGGNNTWITTDYTYNTRGQLTLTRTTGQPPLLIEYDTFGAPFRQTQILSPVTENALIDNTYTPRITTDRVIQTETAHTLYSLPHLGLENIPVRQTTQTRWTAAGVPLVNSSREILAPAYSPAKAVQLTACTVHTDKYGKDTCTWQENHQGNKLEVTLRPYTTNEEKTLSLDGLTLATLGLDGTFNHYTPEYQTDGQKLTATDARGNTQTRKTNLQGQETARTDGAGYTTTLSYNTATGLLERIDHPDATHTRYGYDTRGRKTAEYGTAPYSARYEYDDADRLTTLHTYRNEENGTAGPDTDPRTRTDGDTTRWTYDPVTGHLLQKQYADGHTTGYAYNDHGQLIMQTTARPGVTINYTYTPLTGELSTVTYSDNTPGITYTRNHLGQVIAITDAAGTRTYQYTTLGNPQTENTTGPAASTLNYTRDSYGRPAGHTLTTNGRQIATERLTYDAAGRLAALQINDLPAAGFTWRADNGQLPDTLTYPTGMTKKIAWEEHRDNMTSVEHNPYQGSFISGQTVTRDTQGRVVTLDEARVGHDTITHTYGYNHRGELIADNESVPADSPVPPQAYTYAYDAIGNRTQAWNSRTNFSHLYTANRLNQYTAITTIAEEEDQDAFTPVYDEEGNQTQIRTGTGNWQVTYNADNRPVTFTQGARRIENKYDHQGRRVEKALYQNGQLQKRLHFIYNGYLQIAALDTTNAAAPILLYTLHWDPTEPVATRPLVLIRPEDNGQNWYEYTHTLNKNIANLTDKTGFIVAHYDYDPYGNQTEQTGPLATENPFRYSSEYHDEELGLIYYNYRHYTPKDGRWINRDPISESGGMNLYGFVGNNGLNQWDVLGRSPSRSEIKKGIQEARSLLTQVQKCYRNGSSKCCEDMYNDYVSRLSQLISDAGEFYKDLWWMSDEDQKVMQELYGLPASVDGASLSEEQLAALSNSVQTAGESIGNNIFNKYGTEIENGATFVAGFSDGATLGFAEYISKLAFGADSQWADTNSSWYTNGYWTGVASTFTGYGFARLPQTLTHYTTSAGAMGIQATGTINATKIGLFGPGTYMTQVGRPINLFVPKTARTPITLPTPSGTIRVIPKLVYLRPFRSTKLP